MSKTDTDKAIEEMLGSPAADTEEAGKEKTAEAEKPEANAEADASENTETKSEAAQPEGDGTDWKAEARKWESRSKENKEKADEYDKSVARISELEADNKKVTDDLAALQRANTILELRLKHNVSEEDANLFLTASDEETLEKQAERLSQSSAHAPKPDSAQGTRDNAGPISKQQQGAAALSGLFN